MDAHRLAELRSLRLHQRIADELPDHAEWLGEARARLQRWVEAGTMHPTVAERWTVVLGGSVGEVAARIVRDDETMRDLRQSTPFTFVVSPQERWQIWRKVREEADATP